ncbi:MAG TPA: MBL fold metallo-hydrolase [Methanocorpusculum sp.]|nr:MBL fold metallo-hydrolase [Methanocorpusculum sp.]
MQLTVLCDNYTSSYTEKTYVGEPGFSVYIEDESDKILFDCGYTDVFLKNAETAGIDLRNLTKLVFSHGHDDHTGGLTHLLPLIPKGIGLYAHPDTFREKRRGDMNTGSLFCAEELAETFSMHLSNGPQKVSDHLTFLGEIPSITTFEKRKQFDMHDDGTGSFVPDFVQEDSALVYEDTDSISIITGCSHAGICNICAYAKQLFGKPIRSVLGGFHLRNVDNRVEQTIAYFKDTGVRELYPCHCVSFAVKAAINREIPLQEGGVGLTLTW